MKFYQRFLKIMFSIFGFCILLELSVFTTLEARMGGGRSSGRSSSFRSAPSRGPAPNSFQQQRSNQPGSFGSPQPSSGGGFMRGLAGGLAGGFLGSMLFSSMGHASSGFGSGVGSSGGGGIGFMEIILLAGLAWVLFRLFKNRQTYQTTPVSYGSSEPYNSSYNQNNNFIPATSTIDRETAEDIFFRMQGAWTRRDLSSVREYLSDDFRPTLEDDLAVLKRSGQINRLENISIREIEIGEPQRDSQGEYVSVRFSANLLDYNVDDKTQAVISGSDRTPVKFMEDWTFKKTSYNDKWQLAGIEQAAH